MNKTFRIIILGLFVAQSLVLYVVEGFIPVPFIAPGAKLGLANLITVLALYILPRWQDALTVLLLRILLASLFGGGPGIMIYSIAGGLLSFAVMALLRRSPRFSLIGVSCAGGFAHNIGQLALAVLITGSPGLFLYLPVLGPCGLVTGFLIGFAASRTLLRLPAFLREQH